MSSLPDQSHKQSGLANGTPSSLREAKDLYSKKEFYIYQEAIQKLQNNEDQLPSLPTITLEIRKATANPHTNFAQLSALIAKDPSLTAILMKHASSVYYRNTDKPKNLQDVIQRLGIRTVENLTLLHSVQSLFVLRNAQLKALYHLAWKRQTLKTCISFHVAKSIRFANAEDAIAASLLSEVGTLALLSALQDHEVPSASTYTILCKHYSKHLGAILLAKWGVAPIFMEVLRGTGAWTSDTGPKLQLVDVINLGLFHTIQYLQPQNDLGQLEELQAFKKLAPQHALIKQNKLAIVEDNLQQILTMQKSFA